MTITFSLLILVSLLFYTSIAFKSYIQEDGGGHGDEAVPSNPIYKKMGGPWG